MVGAQISARFTKRIGLERMIDIGGRLAIASGAIGLAVLFIFPHSVFLVIMPMALYVCSVGLILPNATAGAIAPHQDMAGAASALLGFVQMMFAAGAGIIVGNLHDGTPIPMMATVAACGFLGWFFTKRQN